MWTVSGPATAWQARPERSPEPAHWLEPRLMRAGPGCVLCALLVTCIVYAAHAHAERCRAHPVYGSCAGNRGEAVRDAADRLSATIERLAPIFYTRLGTLEACFRDL